MIPLVLSACVSSKMSKQTASDRIIIGPKGYSVDWGLPETGSYWVPVETENNIKEISESCGAALNAFIFHHIPRPPWYSYFGFRFDDGVEEQKRSCVITGLKAVPSLTIYPKK